MDYTSLQTSVSDWLQNNAVSGNVAEIIQIAEGRMKNDIVARSIEKQVAGDTTQPVIWLPDDLNVLQRVVVYRSATEHSVLYAAPGKAERSTNTVGFPEYYNLLDQSLILYPTPDSAYRYIIYYIPILRTLDDTNPTNWMIERAPHCYLYACLKEAANYVKDWGSATAYEQAYQLSLAGILSADNRTRLPVSSPLTIKPRRL